VRPLIDHDLTADVLVAVERIAEHDVAGVAREDAAVRSLEQLREPLDCDLLDMEARGVARDGHHPDRAGEAIDHVASVSALPTGALVRTGTRKRASELVTMRLASGRRGEAGRDRQERPGRV
jgi:hypothetical protein